MGYHDLTREDRKKMEAILSQSSHVETYGQALSGAISLATDYQILREQNFEKRNHLLALKKRHSLSPKKLNKDVASHLQLQGPLVDSHLRRFGLAYAPSFRSINLSISLVEKDFYHTEKGGQKSSYLQAIRLGLNLKKTKARVENLTILKIESLSPSIKFSSSFNRLLDISYYDWFPLSQEPSSETVVRFGTGTSINILGPHLGAIPYIGARYSVNAKNRPLDLGIHAYFYYDLTHSLRFQFKGTRYFTSPFSFQTILNVDLLLVKKNYFSMGINWKKLLPLRRGERFQIESKLSF